MPPQAGSRATPSGLVCLAADKSGGWSLPERSDRSDAPDQRHVRSYLQRHVTPSPHTSAASPTFRWSGIRSCCGSGYRATGADADRFVTVITDLTPVVAGHGAARV